MKKTLSILFILTSLTSFSQVWGNSGAIWHYDFGLFMGGLYTVSYDTDTTIQNFPSQKYTVLRQDIYPQQNGTTVIGAQYTYNQYTRHSGDSVFWFSNNQFHLLYDFGALPGDSWVIDIAQDSTMMCDTVSVVEVIDTGHVQINGLNLRYIDLRHVQGDMGMSGRAVERLGMLQGYNPELSFLFPRPQNCDTTGVVDFWLYNFRCYEDDNFPTYNTNSQSCDYPVATASLQEMETTDKSLIKKFDLFGKETKENATGLLIYLYSDGSTEKVFVNN